MKKAHHRMAKPKTTTPIFFLFFFIQMLFTILVNSYTPTEDFAINCGFSGDSSEQQGHRNWTGDVGSKLFSPIEPKTGDVSAVAKALGSKGIPYATARVSRSEFTYSFPVTDGQKFIRLHFYPFSYLDFDRSNSLFSVKAGPHTLLKDFNASLTADNDEDVSEDIIVKEYCVNIAPGQRLNMTFTPGPFHPNAYAFINGIEVVSMPTNLYYTNPGMELNGENNLFRVENSSSLETAYRINVGGSQIPRDKDTGMFRYWDEDTRYLEMQHPHSVSAGFGLKPIYKDGQNNNFTAPDEVYLTARSYGMNETSKYNVTWEFEVDSEFTYMVRLHFCEFDQKIQKVGDRVFQIFIADTLVESHADVIEWSEGNLIPVHKDYAVRMFSTGSLKMKKLNLSIKLRPHPDPKVSSYNDVIFNGIEVLKTSDGNDNLGGFNPDPRLSPSPPLLPLMKTSKNSKKTTVIPIVVGVASGFLVLSLVVLFISRRSTRSPVNDGSSWSGGQKSAATSTKTSKTHVSSLPSNLCRRFSIVEIRVATNNFDDIFIVGVGGFGNVYKGYIDDGTVPVAIKRLKPGSQQGADEFLTEIEMLSQLRHLHLVSLIGYCYDSNEMILVYEFMARGTLRDHLFESDNEPLSWKQRLEICLGAAKGLHYLHTGAKHSIIHRDVKTTNILIDEKWVAKVSDFGLSKIGPTGMSRSHTSTVVKGSVGYLDPEYYKRQRLTQKSDVYSFGVVLLEVLCGRPPILRMAEKQKASLVEWVRKCHQKGEIDQTVDMFLKDSVRPECLKAFGDMALSCLLDDGKQRPSMGDVVWTLEFALELQEGTEERGLDGIVEEERVLLKKGKNEEEESGVGFTSSKATGSESNTSRMTISSSEEQALVSGTVFSELRDPTVR